jgi:hypothetical protein
VLRDRPRPFSDPAHLMSVALEPGVDRIFGRGTGNVAAGSDKNGGSRVGRKSQ